MRQLQVSMPDGSVWGVDTAVIVDHWVVRHVGRKRRGFPDRATAEQVARTLFFENPSHAGDYELIGWAVSNLHWTDVAACAVEVSGPKVLTPDDFEDGWSSPSGRHHFVSTPHPPAVA